MSFPTNALISEVSKLPSVQRMKVTAKSSVKYGMIVGASTFVGSILGGPVGIVIGGVVSSFVAGIAARNEFESVPNILMNATPEEKRKLAESLTSLLKSRHITTLTDFITKVSMNGSLEDAIIQILIMFLSSELHLQLTN